MGGYAWVTLATNDSYSLGALVLANSLRQVGTSHQLAVLVTPGVTNAMRQKLSATFNVVQEVNILDSKDEANLRLLKRPELGVTFTKLHCWRLTQFEKCVFLDADTLVLRNCDELFDREELSAAPDVGWPDCFNSGVFVYRPFNETYEKLVQFALEKGSFDGGDQGLLNLYFSDWATKDISKHLPFIYNLCSTACYSYLPAFKQFGMDAKIIHFIGSSKPWLQYFNTETRKVQPSADTNHLEDVLQHWWNLFCSLIHPQLTTAMSGLAGAFAQLTLGAPRTTEQSALDDHLRRQAWEVGNIDYMGKDSFDNIWSKICETLSAGLPSSPKTTGEVQPSSQTAPSQDSASVSQSTPLEQPQTISESKASVEAPTKTSVISEETSRVPSVESGNLQCLLKTGSPEIVQVVASTTETPSLSLPKIGTKVPEPTQEAIPAAPLQDEQASGSSPKVPIIQPSAEAFPTSQNSSETPGVFAETPLPSQPLSEVSSVLLSITPAPSLSSSEVSRASQSSTEASPTQSTTEAKSTEVTSSQLSAESSTTPKPMEVSLSEPSGGAPPASHSTETSSAKTPPTLSASAEVPISKPSTEAVKPIEILPISPPSTETPSTPKSLAEIPIPPTEAPFSESLPSPLSTEASVMPKPTEAPPASSHPSTEALPTSPPHAETPSTPKSSAEIPITPTETSSCESLPFQPSTEAPMMSKPTEASPTSQSSPEAKLQAPTPKPSSVVLPRSHPPLSTEASAPQLPTLSKTESLTPSETKTTKSGSEQPKAAKAESATAASSASPTPPPRKAAGSGKKKAKK